MYTNIISGPSKLDLITSLIYSQNATQRHFVTFTTQKTSGALKIKHEVNIVAMKVEDGSGESWLLEGFLKRGNGFSKKINIYYRTDTRAGHIKDL